MPVGDEWAEGSGETAIEMNPSDPDKAADFLEAAFFGGEELLDQATVDLSVELPLIEGYKLLRLLGEGGFGMVYEAEQRVPIRRRVALKVLRPGHTTRELLARFEQERQVLALLNHPHIARIYDAGETEDGRPFIAMELVTGRTIDRHAKGLGLREKVALMRDVCRAVGHAHHKGIIHRDLKPSNILIARPEDGPPEPRVIDFGIAKAMDGPLSSKVMFTQIRQVVGTPGYMSPEHQHTSQISQGADTRADVFALGAILWELVTGSTPVQSPAAGETLVTLPDSKSVPAELRWIVEKATDAEMGRRYANADGLAEDLGRFLEGLPLLAGPQSIGYLVSKWGRRNRTLSLVVMVSTVVMLGALAFILRSYRQVAEALDLAEKNREEMTETISHADYLMGMTRSRRRPVYAMAHWARSLRSDPTNQAALGMMLATWGQRSFVHPIAPTVPIPEGEVSAFAMSHNGQWVALVMVRGDGDQRLFRCRRGESVTEEVVIPADGSIQLLAVSNQGVVAVAGSTGPVGLLQRDSTWLATDREWEVLRMIEWSASGELWVASMMEVARVDNSGETVMGPSVLPEGIVQWATSAGGAVLAVGVEGGGILVFHGGKETPAPMFEAPIPAPFMALAINDGGTHVAAAWRNGEVWVRSSSGEERFLQDVPALQLQFASRGSELMVCGAELFSVWNADLSERVFSQPLDRPLRSVLELEDGSWALIPVYGAQETRVESRVTQLPGFGTQFRAMTDARGRVVGVVDLERRVLEWLAMAGATEASLETGTEDVAKLNRAGNAPWVSLTRKESGRGWCGVDAGGWVCDVSASGGVIREWRCSEEDLRMASIDARGSRVLRDLIGAPAVAVVSEGDVLVEIESAKPSALALAGSGRLAALGLPSGEVRIFDADTGGELRVKDWHRGPVTAMTFVSEGRIALAFGNQIHVWDWESDTTLPSILDFGSAIRSLAVDPSLKRLAAAGHGELHVMHMESGLRVVGQLRAAEDTSDLVWDSEGNSVWALAESGAAIETSMPPLMPVCPEWLPSFMEHHIGMAVNEQGRVVRRLSREPLPEVPIDADPALREWLVRPLQNLR